MERKQLKYFIAVVEEQSFLKAAKKLGITQPPLSISISKLENELDIVLFTRSNKGVTLTLAGTVFYNEIKKIESNLDFNIQAIKSFINGNKKQIIRIGYTFYSSLLPIFQNNLHSLKSNYPDLQIIMVSGTQSELFKKLEEGTLDLIFTENYSKKIFNFNSINYFEQGLVLAAPKSSLVVTDLWNELIKFNLLMTKDESMSAINSEIIKHLKHYGDLNINDGEFLDISILGMISAELGISFFPECIKNIGFSGVDYYPFPASNFNITFNIIFKNKDTSLYLSQLINTIEQS